MRDDHQSWRNRLIDLGEGVLIIAGAGAMMLRETILSAGWRKLAATAAAIAILAAAWSWRDVPTHWLAFKNGERPLYAARSWHYQLDKINVDELAKNTADILVMDYATNGGRIPLTPAEVARLKVRPDGSRRILISYMSIGEAERFRYYFRPEWKEQPPEWLGPENCAWPDGFKIKFWHDGWKDISWRAPDSYLARIIAAGFDGVYLDRVDIYDMYPERASARADMIGFVKDLSATAKRLKPGFFVIPQNADALLVDRGYRAAIDGLGREDLLFGGDETGKRNAERGIRTAQSRLDRLLWEWKPVLAVEYLQTPQAIAATRQELASRGLLATFQPRALDGRDPTAPIDLKKDVGSAEYTKANCEKGKAW